MNDSVTLRRARPADAPAIDRLVRSTLDDGGPLLNPGFWEWKHTGRHFPPSPAWVAEAAGEVVALRIFLSWRFLHGSGELQAVRAVDTATHPDWRRRGLFRRLTLSAVAALAEEGVDLVFNTPNRYSRPGYLAMGWRTVGRAPLLVRPRRPWTWLRRAADGAAARIPEGEPGTAILERPGIDGLLQRVEEAQRRDGRLSTRRDLPYLTWRYATVPGIDYTVRTAPPDGAPGALLVLRGRHRRGRRELTVCDLLVPPEEAAVDAATQLLRRAVRETDADYLLAAAAPRTPEHDALRRAGFWPLPGVGPVVTVLPLSGAGRTGLDSGAWRLSIGELELF